MKRVSVKQMRKMGLCYDPSVFKFFGEDWSGTALDVLRATEDGVREEDYAADRLFVVLRPEWIDEGVLLRFAAWCLRNVLRLAPNVSAKTIEALEAAEGFARGKVSREEFDGKWMAAGYPAWEPALSWLAAMEVRHVVSWEEMRRKMVELLTEDPVGVHHGTAQRTLASRPKTE